MLDVLNRRDVPAVSDLVSTASVAMLPVIDATVGLSFGWFVAFGLIGAIRDVPGMTTRDVLLPVVCKKDGVDMQRFVGVSQTHASCVCSLQSEGGARPVFWRCLWRLLPRRKSHTTDCSVAWRKGGWRPEKSTRF